VLSRYRREPAWLFHELGFRHDLELPRFAESVKLPATASSSLEPAWACHARLLGSVSVYYKEPCADAAILETLTRQQERPTSGQDDEHFLGATW
jgi:hypothetical protein